MKKVSLMSLTSMRQVAGQTAAPGFVCVKSNDLKFWLPKPMSPRRYQPPVSTGAGAATYGMGGGMGEGKSAASAAVLTNTVAPATANFVTEPMTSSFRAQGNEPPDEPTKAKDGSKPLSRT